MDKKVVKIVRGFGYSTLAGIGIGLIFGYVMPLSYFFAIAWCLGFAYTIWIFQSLVETYLYPRFERFTRGKKLACQMSTSLFAYLLGWLLPMWIGSAILGFSFFMGEVLRWLLIFIVGVLIIHSLLQLVRFYRELRDKDVIEERLKTLAAQAELKALKSQINPHFLFNTLNTISSLISTDRQKAEEAVEKLAEVFRYALNATDKEFMTLKDELDFVRTYLDLEKIRFGERLKLRKSIHPDTLDVLTPSLILQPLVENAIKHGIDRETGKVNLNIVARKDKKVSVIEVKDEGPGFHPKEMGTGLKLVSERLIKLYGREYGLFIKDGVPKGTIAIIRIPETET